MNSRSKKRGVAKGRGGSEQEHSRVPHKKWNEMKWNCAVANAPRMPPDCCWWCRLSATAVTLPLCHWWWWFVFSRFFTFGNFVWVNKMLYYVIFLDSTNVIVRNLLSPTNGEWRPANGGTVTSTMPDAVQGCQAAGARPKNNWKSFRAR